MGQPVLACRGLRKTYDQGGLSVPVLLGIDLAVAPGELVASFHALGYRTDRWHFGEDAWPRGWRERV